MSKELVDRLRAVDVSWSEVGELCAEAAAEITRLRAELAGRDAEIAAWLNKRADEDRPFDLPRHEGPWVFLAEAAAAIQSGAYRETRDD